MKLMIIGFIRGFDRKILAVLFFTGVLFFVFPNSLSAQGDGLGTDVILQDTVRARLLFEEAEDLFENGEYETAFILGDSAKTIYENVFSDKPYEMLVVWSQMEKFASRTGRFSDALDYTQNFINFLIDEDFPESYLADPYSYLGRIYLEQSNIEKSLFYFEKCLTLIEKKQSGYDDVSLADIYGLLAAAYTRKGDYYKAILFDENALKIYEEKLGKNHINTAAILNDLGTIFWNQENMLKAISYFMKSAHILKNNLGEKNEHVAKVYGNIGIVYAENKDFKKAILIQKKGLNINLKIFGDKHIESGRSFLNLGTAYILAEEYNEGMYNIKKALDIFKFKLGDNHEYLAYCYLNLAEINMKCNNYEQALLDIQKALDIWNTNLKGYQSRIAMGYNLYSQICFESEDIDASIAFCNMAIERNGYFHDSFEEVVSNKELLSSLKHISELNFIQFENTGDEGYLEKSNESISEALNFINVLSEKYTTKETELSSWRSQFPPIYEQAIKVNILQSELQKNNTLKKEAFTYAEKNKSALLRAQLQEVDALAYSGIPDTLLERESDLRINITYYEKQRQEKKSEGLTETDTIILAVNSKLFDLNQEYGSLKQQFEKSYPDYYRLKYDRSTVSLEEIQNNLVTKNQTLLEYFVGDSSIFLFVVQSNNYEVVEIEKDFPLKEWIEELQQGIYGAYGEGEYTDKKFRETLMQYTTIAPKLYDKLIAPVKNLLTEEVIIIPDGVLGYLPFEALLKAKPSRIANFNSYAFLIKEHRFSYCYSAALLKEMKEKQHRHRQEPEKSLLAFAPFYEGSYEKLNASFDVELDTILAALELPNLENVLVRKTFTKLPSSGEEVLTASKIWNGDYFLNQEATEKRFNDLAGNYRIVHLSTHGVADSRIGDYSFLAFAEQKDSIENEYLYVRDLYNTRLNADLVVLSACETATGELQKGEGIISLARAFAYAGAKSILTTLWVVDDRATKDLTKAFYIQLKKGDPKDLALQKAKLQTLRGEDNRRKHPFFWAAMIGVGDMSIIE